MGRKRVFLLLAGLGLLLILSLAPLLLYLAYPRLAAIAPGLPLGVGIALGAGAVLLLADYLLLVLSTAVGRPLVLSPGLRAVTIRLLMGPAFFVGRVLHVATDAIRRSYIEINNHLVAAGSRRRTATPDQVLVLLPHCLQNVDCPHRITTDLGNCRRCGRCTLGDLLDLVEKTGVHAAVVPGGTLARRVIKETRPRAVVAVACENDLCSGIQDITRIPVLGVLNDRPEGPCYNTRVDVAAIGRALERFAPAPTPAPSRPGRGRSSRPAPDDTLPENHRAVRAGDR